MSTSGSGGTSAEPVGGGASTMPAPGDGSVPPGDFERLRGLLLGAEQRDLAAARMRIAELEKAQRDLPQRLPPALEALRGGDGATRVAAALSEPVTQALGVAVRGNRQTLVDALFPVIGPLIRKSIAEALRNLVADLNGAIESSFTLRGLKWRIEAWRGGVPYAQVVLKHRLSYRIDHVFLIERASGLVLWRASAPELAPLDGDAVAGMLTALGDFVDDSVGEASGGSLESARVGEHLVWVVQGPRANLACFMRGVPPAELRARLEQRLEEVHALLAEDPADRPADGLSATWQALLAPATLLSAEDRVASPRRRAARWPWALLLVVALVALAAFVASRRYWDARVEALTGRLAAQPGFVLQGIDSRPWRALTVHGLIDPDAQPLDRVLAAADLGKVVPRLDLAGYLSTDDAVVARRAARLLAVPAGVHVTVEDGVLRLDGHAPVAWIAMARERASWVAGVRQADFALAPQHDAAAAARAELAELGHMLQGLQVPFADDARPTADAPGVLDDIVSTAGRALALAEVAGVKLVFTSIGGNDETGGDDVNARVRADRSRWLADALAARGIVGVRPGTGSRDAKRRCAWLRLAIEAPTP